MRILEYYHYKYYHCHYHCYCHYNHYRYRSYHCPFPLSCLSYHHYICSAHVEGTAARDLRKVILLTTRGRYYCSPPDEDTACCSCRTPCGRCSGRKRGIWPLYITIKHKITTYTTTIIKLLLRSYHYFTISQLVLPLIPRSLFILPLPLTLPSFSTPPRLLGTSGRGYCSIPEEGTACCSCQMPCGRYSPPKM